MAVLVTRASKGSPLTNTEMDDNLNNLNLESIVGTVASGATITPAATDSLYTVTALATGATFAVPSGTPVNNHKLLIRIKDNGGAQTLNWNAIYRAVGVTLPTTTVAGKTHYIGMVYNSADVKWDVIAVTKEA